MRIYVIENHSRVRRLMRGIYIATIEGLEVCGSSDNAEVVLGQLRKLQSDLFLIDVKLAWHGVASYKSECRQ